MNLEVFTAYGTADVVALLVGMVVGPLLLLALLVPSLCRLVRAASVELERRARRRARRRPGRHRACVRRRVAFALPVRLVTA